MIRVRSSVVTIENPVATMLAACIAACDVRAPGHAISRAANSPGSPKQAIT